MTFLFFPSGGESVLIILAILMLFGADKMPEFFRMFSKGMREFRKATDDIKREFNEASSGIKEEVTQQRKMIENEISGYKDIMDAEIVEDLENFDRADEEEPAKKTAENAPTEEPDSEKPASTTSTPA